MTTLIALGLGYETGNNCRLQLDDFYDDYRDHAYDALSGNLHMVAVGFAFKF